MGVWPFSPTFRCCKDTSKCTNSALESYYNTRAEQKVHTPHLLLDVYDCISALNGKWHSCWYSDLKKISLKCECPRNHSSHTFELLSLQAFVLPWQQYRRHNTSESSFNSRQVSIHPNTVQNVSAVQRGTELTSTSCSVCSETVCVCVGVCVCVWCVCVWVCVCISTIHVM